MAPSAPRPGPTTQINGPRAHDLSTYRPSRGQVPLHPACGVVFEALNGGVLSRPLAQQRRYSPPGAMSKGGLAVALETLLGRVGRQLQEASEPSPAPARRGWWHLFSPPCRRGSLYMHACCPASSNSIFSHCTRSGGVLASKRGLIPDVMSVSWQGHWPRATTQHGLHELGLPDLPLRRQVNPITVRVGAVCHLYRRITAATAEESVLGSLALAR